MTLSLQAANPGSVVGVRHVAVLEDVPTRGGAVKDQALFPIHTSHHLPHG